MALVTYMLPTFYLLFTCCFVFFKTIYSELSLTFYWLLVGPQCNTVCNFNHFNVQQWFLLKVGNLILPTIYLLFTYIFTYFLPTFSISEWSGLCDKISLVNYLFYCNNLHKTPIIPNIHNFSFLTLWCQRRRISCQHP